MACGLVSVWLAGPAIACDVVNSYRFFALSRRSLVLLIPQIVVIDLMTLVLIFFFLAIIMIAPQAGKIEWLKHIALGHLYTAVLFFSE